MSALSPSKIKESTAGLYDAVMTGTKTLGKPQLGDAMFMVTTWEDAGGDKLPAAPAQALSVSGVRLFGISFDYSRLPAPPPAEGVATVSNYSPIEALAKKSGGFWLRGGDDRMPLIVATFVTDFYAVVLKPEQPVAKPQNLRIELVKGSNVVLRPNLNVKDVRFYYPDTLYPCQ
jgi:hypothetical protein